MDRKSHFSSILKISAVALLLSTTSAQQIPNVETDSQKDGIILDNLNNAIKPVKEAMEPYKIHEGEFERGVPKTHDKYGKLILVLYRYSFILLQTVLRIQRTCNVDMKFLQIQK